jgi:hypothetical protein
MRLGGFVNEGDFCGSHGSRGGNEFPGKRYGLSGNFDVIGKTFGQPIAPGLVAGNGKSDKPGSGIAGREVQRDVPGLEMNRGLLSNGLLLRKGSRAERGEERGDATCFAEARHMCCECSGG